MTAGDLRVGATYRGKTGATMCIDRIDGGIVSGRWHVSQTMERNPVIHEFTGMTAEQFADLCSHEMCTDGAMSRPDGNN